MVPLSPMLPIWEMAANGNRDQRVRGLTSGPDCYFDPAFHVSSVLSVRLCLFSKCPGLAPSFSFFRSIIPAMLPAKRSGEFERRFKLAAYTEKWAVTMTKVRIRQAVASSAFPRWHLLTFVGPEGGESRGVVDILAIRKDHSEPPSGAKRGDLFQIILIQVKGGYAAKPTPEDGKRLRITAKKHGACAILLATWKKGKAARFFSLARSTRKTARGWVEVENLNVIFR